MQRTSKPKGRHKAKIATGHIPHRGTCPCGKRIYLEHEARKVAKTLTRNTSERLMEYRSPGCEGWHVGHKN